MAPSRGAWQPGFPWLLVDLPFQGIYTFDWSEGELSTKRAQ